MAEESPIALAIQQIVEEKNISFDSVIETIEAALAVAYRKDFGEKNENVKVTFDVKTAAARVFDVKTVVTDELEEATRKAIEEREQAAAEAEEAGEEAPAEKRPKIGGI